MHATSYAELNLQESDSSLVNGSFAVTQKTLGTISDLKMPESAIAHPDGRIFITEIGERDKKGDGKITVINLDGSKRLFVGGLNDPKGIDLFGEALYVADVDQVVRIDLKGNKSVFAKPEDFPDTPTFLNDIEIDGLGNIFVSDSGDDNGNHAAIYKISPQGKITQLTESKDGIKRPNGLLMNGPNTLLVADMGTGKLFEVDFTEHGNVVNTTITLLNQGFGRADGLARDTNGVLYISDWAGGNVWRLSDPKATPHLVTSGHQSAADISLSLDAKYILMPDMKAGTVVPILIRH
jgi:sugar lactone lactonase YvrE